MRSIAPFFVQKIPKMCDSYISHYFITVTLAYMQKHLSLEVFWYMLSRLLLYASLTPAALAALASDALRRLAVFFLSKPFLTALSSSLWA